MPTNLAINDRLLEEALKVGKLRTKKDTVNQALKEYIERRLQKGIMEIFGSVEFDPKYNYKKKRKRQ